MSNIQSRPTATLYEKKKRGKIFLTFAVASTVKFIGGILRVAVVNLGTFILGNAAQTLSLIGGTLSALPPPVNVGTFPFSAGSTLDLLTGNLRTILINTGTFSNAAAGTLNLLAGSLVTTVISVGTYSNASSSTFSLVGGSLV